MTEKTFRCETCPIRRYTEKHPYSVVASLWRWHSTWCPGWKSYQRYLTENVKSPISGKKTNAVGKNSTPNSGSSKVARREGEGSGKDSSNKAIYSGKSNKKPKNIKRP